MRPTRISRRAFLMVTGGALAAPKISLTAKKVPSLLDHILLGCSDLERGVAFVEKRTGVRAAFGGVHPGRGTQNALLSLGERRYLEIIAPDPRQPDVKDLLRLKSLSEPRLIGWAAHPGDIRALARELAEAGVAAEGPTPGSRKQPNGRVLHWSTLNLRDNAQGLLPFFIEWAADSEHPSIEAPKGCSLVEFEVATPDPESLAKQLARLRLDLTIEGGAKPQLRATIAGPKGDFSPNS